MLKSSIYNFYNNLTYKKNASYDNLAYPISTLHVNQFTFKETPPCSNKKNNVIVLNEESNVISYDKMKCKFCNEYSDMYMRSIPDNIINLEMNLFFKRMIVLFESNSKNILSQKGNL